jgi:hypothetical protein
LVQGEAMVGLHALLIYTLQHILCCVYYCSSSNVSSLRESRSVHALMTAAGSTCWHHGWHHTGRALMAPASVMLLRTHIICLNSTCTCRVVY